MTNKPDYKTDLETTIDIDIADDVTPFKAAPEPVATPEPAEQPNADDTSTVKELTSGKKVVTTKRTIHVDEEYTVQDIHELTGISHRTLSQYFKYGIIKGHKKGKFWHATPDAVKDYLNGNYDRTEYVKAMQPVWSRLNARQMEKRHQLKAAKAAQAETENDTKVTP